jgi:hypothetical protein
MQARAIATIPYNFFGKAEPDTHASRNIGTTAA